MRAEKNWNFLKVRLICLRIEESGGGQARTEETVIVRIQMVLDAVFVSAVVASRPTVTTILRRISPLGEIAEKGLRDPQLRGRSHHVVFTPPLRRYRRSVCRKMGSLGKRTKREMANRPSLPLRIWVARLFKGKDSVIVLETGATADLFRFGWLGNHNLLSE